MKNRKRKTKAKKNQNKPQETTADKENRKNEITGF